MRRYSERDAELMGLIAYKIYELSKKMNSYSVEFVHINHLNK